MNQRTRDQLVGYFGCLLVIGVALGAWAAIGGHLVLTKAGPDGGLAGASITRIF